MARASTTAVMTAVEAAGYLGVNERTIRRAIARGELVAVRVGRGFAIPVGELDRYRKRHDALSDDPVPVDHPPSDSATEPTTAQQVPSSASVDAEMPLEPDGASVTPAERSPLGSLPTPLTSFIGRESDVAALAALLTEGADRLITLTGPGGSGKSRLALTVATMLAPRFAGGAAFVALAPIRQSDDVVPEILRSLGMREGDESSPMERLLGELRHRQVLLLLDNFEHVAEAAPQLVELLVACAGLTMLVTSRIPLRVSGERRLALAPLTVPGPGGGAGTAAVAEADAVRLFVERARAADPEFSLTDANVAAVVEICRRLDGLPLAIELAAARTAILPPAALLERLDRGLSLLTGGPRDQPDRLRTMHGAISWSEDLLDPESRTLLRRLAVFVNGFPLPAAEHVAGDDPQVLERLTALLDGGMIFRDQTGDEPRFGMLEAVREFSLERLAAAGEESAARRAHAVWCLDLVERVQPTLASAASEALLNQLELEQANMRSALAWSIEHDPELALRLASSLREFWSKRSYWREGRSWLERALASGAGDEALRAVALGRLAALASEQGDFDAAHAAFEESLAIALRLDNARTATAARRGLGIIASNQSDFPRAEALFGEALAGFRALADRSGIARSLNDLGLIAGRQGDYDAAIRYQEEALPIFRSLGDEWYVCVVLGNLGGAYHEREDFARGEILSEEALALARRLGDSFGVAVSLYNLGGCALRLNDLPLAASRYREVLGLTATLGERHLASRVIDRIGAILSLSGKPRPAARQFGAAQAVRESIGDSQFHSDDLYMADRSAAVRAMLGPATYEAARAAGYALPYEVATAEAADLALAVAREPVAIDLGLTPREVEVLKLLVDGKSDREIADILFLARTTASKHVAAIIAKLNVESRTSAVAFALRHRLI